MIPDGPSSPTARMLMLDDAAAWFRRMGNSAAEVASRRAIGRIKRREAKLARLIGGDEGGKGAAEVADTRTRARK